MCMNVYQRACVCVCLCVSVWAICPDKITGVRQEVWTRLKHEYRARERVTEKVKETEDDIEQGKGQKT